MNRREALSRVSLLLGGTIIGAEFFLSGCKTTGAKAATSFTAEDIALLDEIGETIIPTTDSPGAKAAKIGEYMKSIVTDCYQPNEQEAFMSGISTFKKAVDDKFGKSFMDLTPQERTDFLVALDKEAKAFQGSEDYKAKKAEFDKQQDEWVKAEEAKKNFGASHMREHYPPHYFSLMKQLTLLGYFTSKPGATEALRYMETPGKFDGAYPYKKGDKAWAL